jgi:hypothetical protein
MLPIEIKVLGNSFLFNLEGVFNHEAGIAQNFAI